MRTSSGAPRLMRMTRRPSPALPRRSHCRPGVRVCSRSSASAHLEAFYDPSQPARVAQLPLGAVLGHEAITTYLIGARSCHCAILTLRWPAITQLAGGASSTARCRWGATAQWHRLRWSQYPQLRSSRMFCTRRVLNLRYYPTGWHSDPTVLLWALIGRGGDPGHDHQARRCLILHARRALQRDGIFLLILTSSWSIFFAE